MKNDLGLYHPLLDLQSNDIISNELSHLLPAGKQSIQIQTDTSDGENEASESKTDQWSFKPINTFVSTERKI